MLMSKFKFISICTAAYIYIQVYFYIYTHLTFRARACVQHIFDHFRKNPPSMLPTPKFNLTFFDFFLFSADVFLTSFHFPSFIIYINVRNSDGIKFCVSRGVFRLMPVQDKDIRAPYLSGGSLAGKTPR